MLIAVTSDGNDQSGSVSEKFERCKYLLIIETDNQTIDAIENSGNAKALAEMIVERDCEALITGEFSFETYAIMADACVTRYKCRGCTVKEAIAMMDRNALDYIRDTGENDACHGEHGGGVCNCDEHD